MDLMLQAIALIRSRMVVVHSPPDPQAQHFSSELMRMSLLKIDDSDVDDTTGTLKRKQQERIALFLNIFNSDWRNTEEIKHHCSVFCPCGGLQPAKLAELAASLFVELILAAKPPIPALSRWNKCWHTAKWFMNLGCMFSFGLDQSTNVDSLQFSVKLLDDN